MISVRGLSYRVGALDVLENVAFDVAFDVACGEGLAIVGGTDDARSVLLRILATQVRPSSGAILIDGVDATQRPFDARRRIGYADALLPGSACLRVDEYLALVERVRTPDEHPVEPIPDMLSKVGLQRHVRVEQLLPQEGAAVALLSALVSRPKVFVVDGLLDEIDAVARPVFENWLLAARERGAALVVSANEGTSVEGLCQRVLTLGSHQVVACAG